MSPISDREGTSTTRPVSGSGKRRCFALSSHGDAGTGTTVADGARTVPEIRPEQDPQLAHSWLSTRTRETRRSAALVRKEGRVRSDRSVGVALALNPTPHNHHSPVTTHHFTARSIRIAPLRPLICAQILHHAWIGGSTDGGQRATSDGRRATKHSLTRHRHRPPRKSAVWARRHHPRRTDLHRVRRGSRADCEFESERDCILARRDLSDPQLAFRHCSTSPLASESPQT